MTVGPRSSVVASLREVLSTSSALRLAVLFGSRAKDAPRRVDSDVDVAIWPADADFPLRDELSLAATLSQRLDVEVDIVRLDSDAPLLGREIARDGICVFESEPGLFAAWRATAMSRFIDFEETIAPHRRRFLERLASGHR